MKSYSVLECMRGVTIDAAVRTSARCQHDGLPHMRIVKNVTQICRGILI